MKQNINRPNIIVLLADDLGYGDVSCYNPQGRINTVNIDKCADEGLMFTNAHATSALCTPSRYSLLTGRYNWRSRLKQGAFHNYDDNLIEDDRITVAEMLKGAGYKTSCIGKWHLGMKWEKMLPNTEGIGEVDQIPDFTTSFRYGPVDFGFDHFFGIWGSLNQGPHVFLEDDHVCRIPDTIYGDYDSFGYGQGDTLKYGCLRAPADSSYDPRQCCDIIQKKVLDTIDEYCEGDDPFFIYYPTPAVHIPIIPTEKFAGKSGIGAYGDFVLQLDSYVKEIMDKLKEKGIEEDTIFIFTSDNGCAPHVNIPDLIRQGHNPSYIYRGRKGDIYEGGHRVPYIVRYPRLVKPGKSDQMISLADLYRTLADLLGQPVPDCAAEDSVSNLPLWKGEDIAVREDVCSSSILGNLCIQEGDWKLETCPASGGDEWIGHFDELEKMEPKFQLYNMRSNVTETCNLYELEPEIADRLLRKLAKYIKDGRSTPGAPQKNTGNDPNFWRQISWIKDL